MDIRYNDLYTLTTDHPASHYGLGVLVSSGDGQQCYGPSDELPISQKAIDCFGAALCHYTAGEFVRGIAAKKIWSDDEIALMRKYLSQSPDEKYILPDEITLREEQAVNCLNDVMGDCTQGVHRVYYALGEAQVTVKMYEATGGKYTVRFWGGFAALTHADTGKDVDGTPIEIY